MSTRTRKTAPIILLATLNVGLFSQTSVDTAMQELQRKNDKRNSTQIHMYTSEILFDFHK